MLQEIESELNVSQNKIHIYIKQRTGNKYVTCITKMPQLINSLKKLKHTLCCSAHVEDDYIYLSGDQREKLKQYIIKNNIIEHSNIVVHGF